MPSGGGITVARHARRTSAPTVARVVILNLQSRADPDASTGSTIPIGAQSPVQAKT